MEEPPIKKCAKIMHDSTKPLISSTYYSFEDNTDERKSSSGFPQELLFWGSEQLKFVMLKEIT